MVLANNNSEMQEFYREKAEQRENIKFNIYPNPVTNKATITVKGNISDNVKVDVFKLNGRLVNSLKLENGKCYIDSKHFDKGTYIIRIMDNGITYVNEKIVVL